MTSPNNGDLTRYRLDNRLLGALVKHIEKIVVGKKQTQNMSYLNTSTQQNLSSFFTKKHEWRQYFKHGFWYS